MVNSENSMQGSIELDEVTALNHDEHTAAAPVAAPAPNKITPGKILVASIGEFLGTFTYLFLGCTGCIHDLYGDHFSHQFAAFSYGLAVAMAIQMFGHISGAHYNPAVTVAALIMGHIELIMVPFYFIAQTIGAILGYGLILLLLPKYMTENLCVAVPHPDIYVGQALVFEIIATSLLIFAVCSVWDKRCYGFFDSVSIRLGLMLTSVFIAFGPLTGPGINPTRALAPAIFHDQWSSHWIYWVGPMAGGVLTSLFYKYTFIEGLSKL